MGGVEEMIHNIFPTRIYMNKVGRYDEIQKEFTRAKEIFDTEVGWDQLWDSHLITDDQFVDNIVKKYNLTAFEEELKRHVSEYVTEANQNGPMTRQTPLMDNPDIGYRITASWMARYDKGHHAICHEHGWADIAGVYYYQTNGEDGNIYFQTPVLAQTTTFWDSTPNTQIYPPEQGGIILFPGWMRHGVHANTTDHTRISVSFNLTFDREI